MSTNIEKQLLNKIDNGENLSKSELITLVTEFKVITTQGEDIFDELIFSNTEKIISPNCDTCEIRYQIVRLINRYFYQKYEIKWDSIVGVAKLFKFYNNQPIEVYPEIRTEKHRRWVDSSGIVRL